MRKISFCLISIVIFIIPVFSGLAQEDNYSNAAKVFKDSEAVQPFFNNAYGYVIFPVIGKGGFGVGGSYGKGKVYKGDKETGTATLIKLSVGFQAGGQAFSEIIFFQDKRAYDEFTSGQFAFDAQASAAVITAGAGAQAGSKGASAGASAGPRSGVQTNANYRKGMAAFVHVKGGLMYEAAIGGQKFTFKPIK